MPDADDHARAQPGESVGLSSHARMIAPSVSGGRGDMIYRADDEPDDVVLPPEGSMGQ
jgi:hypothetical protein